MANTRLTNAQISARSIEDAFEEISAEGIETQKLKTTRIEGVGPFSNIFKNLVVDGNVIVDGDLLITGKIKRAFKYKLEDGALEKVTAFLREDPNKFEGRDYYIGEDGIIVLVKDKEEYKGLIMEALI